MVKNEYVVRNKKLYLIKDGEEFECSKEELTEIIQRQDKNRAQLSDEYLGKVEEMMKNAAKVDLDVKYDIFKVALNGLLASGMDDISRATSLADDFATTASEIFTN